MIVLGIDPSLNSTGWAVVRLIEKNNNPELLEFGSFTYKPGGDMFDKIKSTVEGLIKITDKYNVDEVAIEESVVNKNPSSSLKLGIVRGACLSIFMIKNIKITQYKPTSIKLNIVGNGRADKKQVEYMVKCIIGKMNLIFSNDDESDALAIAISHTNIKKYHIFN